MAIEEEPGGRGRRAPDWLWRWGVSSWLLLGIIGLLIVVMLAVSKARELVLPLLIATLVGVVLEPVSRFLHVKLHLWRWLAAGITMLLVFALLVGLVAMLVYGVASQAGEISDDVEKGVDEVQEWFSGLKLSKDVTEKVTEAVEKAWQAVASGLLGVVSSSLSGAFSLVIGVFLALFILFFLLNDWEKISAWVIGHTGLPRERSEAVFDDVTESLRGYFKGTTIIAVANALTILPFLLVLGVPLAGTITIVTFVTAYIPSIGGYISGAFAVLIALAGSGLTEALIILAVVILANTVIQNPIQAVAYGKTLDLNPLVALLATILGAIFFGVAGAIFTAPLTAVVLKVVGGLKEERLEDEAEVSGRGAAGNPDG